MSGSRTAPTSVWRRSSSDPGGWSWTPSPGTSSAGRSPITLQASVAAQGARQGHRLAWRLAEGPDPSFRPRGAIRARATAALRLSQIGAHASMSRPGTPQDNAKAESFMHTLKAEEVDAQGLSQPRRRREQDRRLFIDDVYNARRLHSLDSGCRATCRFRRSDRRIQRQASDT